MLDFSPNGLRKMSLAVAYFFALYGVTYGTIVSRIPALKNQTGLDEAGLGLALLCLGLGALLAFPCAGLLQQRLGSKPMQKAGALALLLAFPLIALSSNFLSLCLTMLTVGLASGFTEVAMGTQAVLLERSFQKPLLSTMHAMYSLGGLLGSLGGSLLTWLSPVTHFCLIAAALVLIWPFASARLLNDVPLQRQTRAKFKLPPAMVFLLGLLVFFSYSSEGSVGDWGALYLTMVRQVPENVAALAYACFSLTMFCGRLFGDRLRRRIGDYALLQGLTIVAACGMLVVLYAPLPALNLLGYALVGLGLSVVAPIVFSSVGKMADVDPGAGVTVLTTLGYGGLLLVPPLLGLLARQFSLSQALQVVLLFCLLLALGSRLVRKN